MLHPALTNIKTSFTNVDPPKNDEDLFVDTRVDGDMTIVYIGFPLISALAWRTDILWDKLFPFSIHYTGLEIDGMPGGWFYVTLHVMATGTQFDDILENVIEPAADRARDLYGVDPTCPVH